MSHTDKDHLNEIIKALSAVDTKCQKSATDCHDCPMEPLCDLKGDAVADIINALQVFEVTMLNDTKELVFCKDCKHRPILVGNDIEAPGDDDYTCLYLCADDPYYNYMPPDEGFCHCGERGA